MSKLADKNDHHLRRNQHMTQHLNSDTALDSYFAHAHSVFSENSPEKKPKLYFFQTSYKVMPEMTPVSYIIPQPQAIPFKPTSCQKETVLALQMG